jgi:hypothetical protein
VAAAGCAWLKLHPVTQEFVTHAELAAILHDNAAEPLEPGRPGPDGPGNE